MITRKDTRKFLENMQIDLDDYLFTVNDLYKGMLVEMEHGFVNDLTNVTNDSYMLTGKIALAHLLEFPDYYKRLARMEKQAKKYWSKS